MSSGMATDWPRLGEYAKARRRELGITQEGVQELGGPSPALVRQIEKKTYSASMNSSLKRGYERALQWAEGSIDKIHSGGEPAPLGADPQDLPKAEPPAESRFDRLAREADEAQAEFERAVGELAAAEARVDATSRNVFSYLAYQNKFAEEVTRRERDLGRKLTQVERLAIDSMDRPTPRDIAELIATHAEIDPHEWTRYEMALIEIFDGDYPRPVEEGSRYADLAPARARAARLLKLEGGTDDGISEDQKITGPGIDLSASEHQDSETK